MPAALSCEQGLAREVALPAQNLIHPERLPFSEAWAVQVYSGTLTHGSEAILYAAEGISDQDLDRTPTITPRPQSALSPSAVQHGRQAV